MAVTLIVNPGSSSKKYALVRDGRVMVSYNFERVGSSFELTVTEANGRVAKSSLTALGYTNALKQVLTEAVDAKRMTVNEVTRVGVRVVAPGTYFTEHRIVDGDYETRLQSVEAVAPLHIPHTIAELRSVQSHLPGVTIIGVSDSAFHSTLAPSARTFPITHDDACAFDLFRFGYHGLSVASVVSEVPKVLGALPERMVVCHIGSGMSMTAVRAGKSIDTTMGFAPGSGLFMGARTGDLEPAVVLELMRRKNLKIVDIQNYLQTKGGFMGQVGESDFRHLLGRLDRGEEAVVAAFTQCVYQFQKTLGAFYVALGGLDAVVFTATAVERSPQLRALFCVNLTMLGITLDDELNESLIGRSGCISGNASPVKVSVVRTNELLEMTRITNSF